MRWLFGTPSYSPLLFLMVNRNIISLGSSGKCIGDWSRKKTQWSQIQMWLQFRKTESFPNQKSDCNSERFFWLVFYVLIFGKFLLWQVVFFHEFWFWKVFWWVFLNEFKRTEFKRTSERWVRSNKFWWVFWRSI